MVQIFIHTYFCLAYRCVMARVHAQSRPFKIIVPVPFVLVGDHRQCQLLVSRFWMIADERFVLKVYKVIRFYLALMESLALMRFSGGSSLPSSRLKTPHHELVISPAFEIRKPRPHQLTISARAQNNNIILVYKHAYNLAVSKFGKGLVDLKQSRHCEHRL